LNSKKCSAAEESTTREVNENPEWQTFVSFHQDIDMDAGTTFFNISYAWRDDVTFDADLDPNTKQKAYGLLDARIGFNSYQGLGVSLFVNNATNEDYAVRIIDAPVWPGAFQRYPGEQRTYGIEVSYLYE